MTLELLSQYLGKAETIYQTFTAFTKVNPVVGGMLGMWILGSATYLLRLVPDKISYLFHRYCTTSITIASREKSYGHLLRWLKENNKLKNPRTVRANNGRWGDGKLNITAGLGHHYFRIGLRPFKLLRVKEKADSTSDVKEEITLTTLGFKTDRLVALVESTQPKTRETKPEIYAWTSDDWNYLQDLNYRSLDSVILKKGQKERILDFIKNFENNQEWYERTGVPYRTGILFSGPAGTGKTSLIRAIASEQGKDLRLINCSQTTDNGLVRAMSEVSENTIILLEDFDAVTATHSRENEEAKTISMGVTLSGLLNALDGVFSSEGRIVIATTNYPEKLDAALLRPGRFDLKEELGYVDIDMIVRIYNKFFPDGIDKFQDVVPTGISPAQIENCCLVNKDSQFNALMDIYNEIEKKKTNNKTDTGNTKTTTSTKAGSTPDQSIPG